LRHRIEYAIAWLLLRSIGVLPRPVARAFGIGVGKLAYLLFARLRRVGMQNLTLAFPEKTDAERRAILKGVYRSLGRQLAEFCLLPRYQRDGLEKLVVYDGLDHYLAAKARGKGVLFATAHLSAWEVSSFAHSLYGHPMAIMVRPLDNPYVDRMVTRLRTMHGNRVIRKESAARALLSAMKANETVGILADINMWPPQGIFVDFFGIPACTAGLVARVAMHTDAAVLPAFIVWDEERKRYRIVFEPAITLVKSEDAERDVVSNTQALTLAIESMVRRYPDQWLWLHRRWKARPPGEAAIYS